MLTGQPGPAVGQAVDREGNRERERRRGKEGERKKERGEKVKERARKEDKETVKWMWGKERGKNKEMKKGEQGAGRGSDGGTDE